MAERTISIAQVALARDLSVVLRAPAVLAALGLGAVLGGLLLGGSAALALFAAAAILAVAAVLVAAIPLSAHVDVEVGGLRVRWFGGSRRFHLVRGSVTRVPVRADGTRLVRPRIPLLGWWLGRATLRGDETIWLLRLAASPTLILVPTEAGRLAIAPAAEGELLDALAAAARVQQRLDEVSGRVQAALPTASEPEAPPERREAPAEAAPAQHFLTGIERARLEERLAAARAEALLAAEAERRAAGEEASAAGSSMAPAAIAAAAQAARRAEWEEEEREPPMTAPSAARRRIAATWTRPAWATDGRLFVLVTICWALVPLALSGVAWLVGAGDVLRDDSSAARLTSLTLTLAGPATALAILAARRWWPRMTGIVTVTGVLAAVLIVRGVIG
jgi:hypothetical protein